ncbi:MAG TPA: diacylglycerol kinase family protein, partial [Candidatus Dormibacteraeota bacterium]|nr:diacylglycerol kinase family protein [Candidatus Dormibacteraeota bacterium]
MAARLARGQGRPRPDRNPQPARAGRCVIAAPVLFVVNPASGAGKAAREWSSIAAWLTTTGLPFDAALTTRPGEAIEIAERAVRESRPIVVAVGGDGTLNEVVNGFFHNGAPIPTTTQLGMVPLGTGGDFRRTLRIPLDPKEAVHVIQAGTRRRLDAGCVTFTADGGSSAVRHFINIADAGLGGEVAHRVNVGSKRLGSAAFTIASALALIGWKNKPMQVVVDGNAIDIVAQQVVVANCQYFGGGMRMAPSAKPTDGVFDVILVGNVGKIETARKLGSIRNGTHLDDHNPKIQLMYGKRISVTSTENVRVDLDGETPGTLPALFEIQP